MNSSISSSQSQPEDSIRQSLRFANDTVDADRVVGGIERLEPAIAPTENVAGINWSLPEVWEELQAASEELKQRQIDLEEERLKYHDLFNFAPDGYLVTTPLGVIQSANQTIGHQLGMAPHHLVGKPLIVFITPADCSLFYGHLNRRWCLNQSQTGEISLKPRQGDTFPAEFTIAPIYDRSNTLTGLRWLIRDITERKQAQTLRQQAEHQLQTLIEGTAATTGKDYFPALVSYIAKALNVSYALVSEKVDDKLNVLAFWANDSLQSTFAFPIACTPCQQALEQGQYYCKSLVQVEFPANLDLVEMKAESYLGIALQDTQGRAIGNLCILDQNPIQDPKKAENLLRVFAARAAAELERERSSQALAQLNQELEQRVIERTAALQKSEQRYRALMDGASDAIILADAQGYLIEVNQAAEALLGYNRDELIRLHMSEIHPPAALAAAHNHFQNVVASQTVPILSSIVLRKDGSELPVDITASRIEIDGVQIAQGIFRDVTERQRTEIALQESLYFTQKIADTSPNILYIYDIQAQCNVYVNRAIEKILGYTTAEVQAMGASLFQTLLHPDDFSQVPAQYAKILQAQDGDILEFEYRMKHANGEWRWLMGKDSVFSRDAHGRVQQTIGTAQDITAAKQEEFIRKQAEDLICQQAERAILLKEITQRIRQSLDLQTIFDTACQEIRDTIQSDRVGIFKFDPASNFDDGEFVAESVGAEFPSALAIRVKDHCFGENYAALYAKGRSYVVNDIYQNNDRACHTNILALFQVRANLVMPLLCGDNLWGLLCIHQCAAPRNWQQSDIDLTQQIASQLTIAIQQANLFEQVQQELAQKHQAEVKLTETNHELAVSNQELIRATRLKDEFLANMSHELRTPLNAILGLSESFLEEVFGTINDRQKKAIATVERSGQHLLSLINDILEVSKIEAGKLELEITTVSATTLTNSTLAFVKQLAHQKQIQLTTTFAPDLGNIDVDERRIRQVLINLLNNAVKFTPAGGQVTLEVQLEQAECALPSSLDLRQQLDSGAWILFAVTDTGIGITPENQLKLFKPFVQIDGSLNRHYQGTGLGLTLVKQIVELHGGSVALASEFGQGSCFTVRLPYHATAEQRTISILEPTPSLSIADEYSIEGKYPLILLAEDNQDNIDTLSSYLEACNYRLIIASNGYEAISILEGCLNSPADLPALILMDIQMPGIDGLETIQRIRQHSQLADLPIIALTALAMEGDREKCLAAGANDYMTKPVKLKQLNVTIKEFLTASKTDISKTSNNF